MADVIYTFVSRGHDTVKNAFRSIHDASIQYGKGAEQSFGGAAKAAEQGARRQRTAAEGVARAGEQAASREVKAAEKAEAAKARAAEKALAHVSRIRERYFAEQQKAGDKAERAAERLAEKEARAQERALKHVQGIRERYFRDQQRQEERAEAQARRERADTFASLGGHAFRFIGGAALSAGTLATGLTVAAARESLKLQDIATRVSIQSRQHGQEYVDPVALRKEFEAAAAQAPGIGAADVGEAVSGFVSRTGDLDVARRNARTFATVASASGGNVQDIAGTAADLFQKFGIQSERDMQDAFAVLMAQGKKGAFELKDAAAHFSELSAAASAFGIGKGAGSLRTLGGLTQIARSSSGSPAEAATAVQDMFAELQAKGGKLKRDYHVDVYRDGKARDIRDILTESIAKIGGFDVTKKMAGLTEVFGIRGLRAINPLISKYNEAAQETQGTKEQRQAAGVAAIRAAFADAIDAMGDYRDVQRDAAKAQESTSAKVTDAWERVVAQVGDKLLPGLLPLMQDLPKIAPALDPAIQGLALFASGLGTVVQTMQDEGLIKAPSRAEKLAAAKDELARFDEANGGTIGPPTAEQAAKRNRLVDKVARYDVGGAEAAFATQREDLTREEFVSEFVKAQGARSWLALGGLQTPEQEASGVYRRLLLDPNAAAGVAESGRGLNYSTQATDLVERMAEQITAGRTVNVGKDIEQNAGEAGKALHDLVPAVHAFAAAMKSANPEQRASTLNPGGY